MNIDPFCEDTDYEPLKLKPAEPLRIIQKPEKDRLTRQWVIRLSDGRTVNDKQLAVILGIRQQSMWSRFDNLPWDDPEIMAVGRRKKKKKADTPRDLSHIKQGALAHLSSRQRA